MARLKNSALCWGLSSATENSSFPPFYPKTRRGGGLYPLVGAKSHGTKKSVTFVPLLSLAPILGLETGEGLKLVQTISRMKLITLPSESEIKNEMMDPGSLKSPCGKGKDSNDLHWGTARAQHLTPDQGPVLVSQDLGPCAGEAAPTYTSQPEDAFLFHPDHRFLQFPLTFLLSAWLLQKTISQFFHQTCF